MAAIESLMDDGQVARAASLLAAARSRRARIDRLPLACRPVAIEDAFRIQRATVRALNEEIGGWKVGPIVQERTSWGIVVASRLLCSGGAIAAAEVPMLGVEAEIAFRFMRAAEPRAVPYTYDEVAERVVACVAIEIVDSRHRDYAGTPIVERIADFMSSGALVVGPPLASWRVTDFRHVSAKLEFDGDVVASTTGGHVAGDPLLPAVELANELRAHAGIAPGQVVTTGTFTGLHFATPGQRVRALFDGVGVAGILLR